MNCKVNRVIRKISKLATGKDSLSELKDNILKLIEKYFSDADEIFKNELIEYAYFYQNFYLKKAIIKSGFFEGRASEQDSE